VTGKSSSDRKGCAGYVGAALSICNTQKSVTWCFMASKRDRFESNRNRALIYYLSMIFSENQFPLFRIML